MRAPRVRSQSVKAYAVLSEPMIENNFCYVEITRKLSHDHEKIIKQL